MRRFGSSSGCVHTRRTDGERVGGHNEGAQEHPHLAGAGFSMPSRDVPKRRAVRWPGGVRHAHDAKDPRLLAWACCTVVLEVLPSFFSSFPPLPGVCDRSCGDGGRLKPGAAHANPPILRFIRLLSPPRRPQHPSTTNIEHAQDSTMTP